MIYDLSSVIIFHKLHFLAINIHFDLRQNIKLYTGIHTCLCKENYTLSPLPQEVRLKSYPKYFDILRDLFVDNNLDI